MFLQLQLLSILVPLLRVQGEFIKVHLHRVLMCLVVPCLHQRLNFPSYLSMRSSHFISSPFPPFNPHSFSCLTCTHCESLSEASSASSLCLYSKYCLKHPDWTLSRTAGLCLTQSFFFFPAHFFLSALCCCCFFYWMYSSSDRTRSLCQYLLTSRKNSFQCALPPGSNILL